ncbi:MAG: hypothetical protein J6X93_04390 [Bacilli bacterium]|nr:hypothetical protein [Bacilli bacterium]
MSNKVTWAQFESLSSNIQDDFERLSRLFFKYRYVKDANALLPKCFNNPGIETEPILIDGLKVGFQAKYFAGRIGYEQILDSTNVLINNYSGKIDKVIFFCNKDIKKDTVNFKKVMDKLQSINATYELCCNDSMLDVIKTDEEYSKLKELFFGCDSISDDWFKTQLDKSLVDLAPRYEKTSVHIGVNEESYIHYLYRDNYVFEELNRIKANSIERLRNLHFIDSGIKNLVFRTIHELQIPCRAKLELVFDWYGNFKKIKNTIENNLKNLSDKIILILSDDKSDKTNLSDLYQKRDDYYTLSSIIDSFDMRNNSYTKYLQEKIMIIEGDAGTGKSHLLGYIADLNSQNADSKTILLLGNKFLFEDTPTNQITKILGIKNDFDSFLLSLEAKGELDGTDFVIMIDAINECDNYSIWKSYLNDLITSIDCKKHIKLVMSIRSTYKNDIFNNNILKRIHNNEIPHIETSGFKHNLDEALPVFFDYYKIPLNASCFFNYELENPLFLKVYCETYDKSSFESNNLFSMFLKYLEINERNIKNQKGIDIDIYYSKEIIKKIGKYFYDNNSYRIPYFEIIKTCNDLIDSDKIIDGFIKAKILIKYHFDGELLLSLNYQRFADYSVAIYLSSKYKDYELLNSFLTDEIKKINNKEIASYNWLGYISALSVLKAEYFDAKFKWLFDSIENQYFKELFVDEYINAYSFRSDKDLKIKNYESFVFPVLKNINIEKHFDLLVKLSLRHCELNACYLNNYLNGLSLTQRDYLWTIYINERYENGYLIYKLINFAFKHDLTKFETIDICNYLLLLGQFLSSSNRELRDKASKAITLIISYRCEFIIPLLDYFLHSVDPYIVSRIMGCCYGAILNIEDYDANKALLAKIANYIYENVFKAEPVYQDILFRDYSLNIVDTLIRKGIKTTFNLEKIIPPYKAAPIPNISEQAIINLYNSSLDRSGLKIIKFSMMPELSIEGFGSGYGDFGRYTFDSALKYFEGFDKKTVFKYAFFYLINDLKYDEKIFTAYDCNVGYGRDRHYSKKERIGKKYEWITMYHILALISDLYPLNNRYSDANDTKYRGTWYPYVRDYDPSLFIDSMDRIYDLGIKLLWDEYVDWDFKNKSQWNDKNDLDNYRKFIFLKDSNAEEWVSLHFSNFEKKEIVLNKEYESVWMTSTAVLIKSSEKDSFIKKVKQENFWGRWFEPAEVVQEYTVFLKEYVDSCAFDSVFAKDDFIAGLIPCGKKTITQAIPNIVIQEDGNIIVNGEINKEIECNEYLHSEKVSPCYMNYLWEEEYDYSKKENINIYLPSKFIIKVLGLQQKKPGLWFIKDKLVAVDFQFVKNSNVKGIYIRKSLINILKKKGYELVWIGMGEKIVGGDIDCKKCLRNDISSLVWFEEEEIKEINHFKKTN